MCDISGTANEVVEACVLLHGEETDPWGGTGYRAAGKLADAKDSMPLKHSPYAWASAANCDRTKQVEDLTGQCERIKGGIRAKVEHLFRVIERQFAHTDVRYQG